VKPAKYQRAAQLVRDQVADGRLPPGAPAPSGAALARATGYSVLTCRRALRILIADGVLAPGPSRNARPRVPGPSGQAPAAAALALSAALASRRRARGLTQPQLAALMGLSVTTIAHAETSRHWQRREFWETADAALGARGKLLRLYEASLAAQAPFNPAPTAETAAPDAQGGAQAPFRAAGAPPAPAADPPEDWHAQHLSPADVTARLRNRAAAVLPPPQPAPARRDTAAGPWDAPEMLTADTAPSTRASGRLVHS
jgi:DNA-binding transcriptional MocR family regulator